MEKSKFFNVKPINKRTFALRAKISLVTGLHIGGGDTLYEIGGLDNPVIKDPNGFPYIPGSSLKGKLRSVLEVSRGLVQPDGKVSEDKELEKLFGSQSASKNEETGVGWLIFRDCPVIKSDENKLPFDYFEIKYENTINRATGKTKEGGLRQTERVKPGTEFKCEIILNLRNVQETEIETVKDNAIKLIEEGIKLLEADYLGGSGTRGYGQVKFSPLEKEE